MPPLANKFLILKAAVSGVTFSNEVIGHIRVARTWKVGELLNSRTSDDGHLLIDVVKVCRKCCGPQFLYGVGRAVIFGASHPLLPTLIDTVSGSNPGCRCDVGSIGALTKRESNARVQAS